MWEDEHTGETQCGESASSGLVGCLGESHGSDAHCPGLAGSVPRLLGGSRSTHGLVCPAAEVGAARGTQASRSGRHRRCSTAPGGASSSGLGTVLGDEILGVMLISFHFTVQSAPRGYFLLLFILKIWFSALYALPYFCIFKIHLRLRVLVAACKPLQLRRAGFYGDGFSLAECRLSSAGCSTCGPLAQWLRPSASGAVQALLQPRRTVASMTCGSPPRPGLHPPLAGGAYPAPPGPAHMVILTEARLPCNTDVCLQYQLWMKWEKVL